MILAAVVLAAASWQLPAHTTPRTGMGLIVWAPLSVTVTVAAPFLAWTPSPDPMVPPAAYGYECLAWERHQVPVACPPETQGPCFGTSAPVAQACPVRAYTDPDYIWSGVTTAPAPGQVVYGCVRAVTVTGRYSDCVGGGV